MSQEKSQHVSLSVLSYVETCLLYNVNYQKAWCRMSSLKSFMFRSIGDPYLPLVLSEWSMNPVMLQGIGTQGIYFGLVCPRSILWLYPICATDSTVDINLTKAVTTTVEYTYCVSAYRSLCAFVLMLSPPRHAKKKKKRWESWETTCFDNTNMQVK